MSHVRGPDNHPLAPGPAVPPVSRPAWRRLALPVAGLAWAATLFHVLRSEVVRGRESADVRALVESARLTRVHASAMYLIRVGDATVGRLSSTVSGGQHEEQLTYVLDGELTIPQRVRLKGVVLAGWDRRPQRLVLEAATDARRHRLEGTLRPDSSTAGSIFELRYVPPPGGAPLDGTWVLPEAPLLAPGPLPFPEFPGDELTASYGLKRGAMPGPGSGPPMGWSVVTSHLESFTIAGRERQARRHDVRLDAWEGRAWTEASGFPLRLELPGSITIELTEEER